MRKIIGSYQNGNYTVIMMSDGTKIRMNNLDNLTPDFPESIDMKISNKCSGPKGFGPCGFCHEQSHPNGELANLSHPLLDSLHPYTELALGGGNVLEHPDLFPFLSRMKDQKVICNMTLHLDHFLGADSYIKYLQEEGYIHGIGISVNKIIDQDTIDKIKSIPNTVVHTIAGIMPIDGYKALYDNDIKLLILGYKYYGRGKEYIKHDGKIMDRIGDLHSSLMDMMPHFNLISFDNLALEQLRVKELVDKDTWNRCYMGDDGDFTCYVDLVSETFAKSSVSDRIPINSNKIEDLFNQVRV